jgi:TonB family protein
VCTGTTPAPALPPQIGEKACLSCPPPQLPPAYRRAGVSLQALVKICVDARGQVRTVNVLKGISATVDAEIASTIRRWRYSPHAINGNPVPFCYATLFTFKVL